MLQSQLIYIIRFKLQGAQLQFNFKYDPQQKNAKLDLYIHKMHKLKT
jgi:hypothetical protein